MRDARFDRDTASMYWYRLREQGRQAERESWYPLVVDALHTWYRGKIQAVQTEDVESLVIPADDALHAALAGIPGLAPDQADAIAAWQTSAGTSAEEPVANHVWGTALGRAAITLLQNDSAFQHTQTMVAARAASDAYLAALAAALRGDARDSVLAKMSHIVARTRSLAACYVLPHVRESYPRILDTWRNHAGVHDVWDLRRLEELGGSCTEVWLLDAVRRYDRRLYLDLLEQTRHPLAIQQAFGAPSISEDTNELQELLAAAPMTCIAPSDAPFSGEWLRHLTAPLLLEAALHQAERLAHLIQNPAFGPTSQEELEVFQRDLTDRFRGLVNALLGRSDGPYLAGHWALHLADRLAHLPWPAPLTSVSLALQILTEALATAGIDAAAFEAAIPVMGARGSTLGVLMVLIALRRLPNGGDAYSSEATPARASLRTILDKNPGDVSSARDTNPPSWVHAYTAMLFVEAPDPRERWTSAWADLASQRHEMLFNTGLTRLHADEPSLFLVYVGIAALHCLLADGTSESDEIMSLWQRLFDVSLAIVLRLGTWSKRPSADRWRRALIVLWTLLPACMAHEGRELGAHELSALFQRLGGDDELLIEATAYLHRGGVPAADLCEAAARSGADLAASLDRYTVFIGKYRPRQHTLFNPVDECRSIIREVTGATVL